MFNDFKAWVAGHFGSKYQYSMGAWIDAPSNTNTWFCALYKMGGPAIDSGEVRRPRYRVLLVGPQSGRQHAAAIVADLESLIQLSMGDTKPCGAASVRALGEIVGPAYTTENRAWASVDFQITF